MGFSETLVQANENLTALCTQMTKLINDNHALVQKMRTLQVSQRTKSRRTTINSQSIRANQSSETPESAQSHKSRRKTTSVRQTILSAVGFYEFDNILSNSRPYKRCAMRGSSVNDVESITTDQQTETLSIATGLTAVDDISDISVFSLPLFKSDICNSESYTFGSQKNPAWPLYNPLNTVPDDNHTTIRGVDESGSLVEWAVVARSASTQALWYRLDKIPGFDYYLAAAKFVLNSSLEECLIKLCQMGKSLCFLYNHVDRHLYIELNLLHCDCDDYVRHFLDAITEELELDQNKICTFEDIFSTTIDAGQVARITWTISHILDLIHERPRWADRKLIRMSTLASPGRILSFIEQDILEEQLNYMDDLYELIVYKRKLKSHYLQHQEIDQIFGNIKEIYVMEKNLWNAMIGGKWGIVFSSHVHRILRFHIGLHLGAFVKYARGVHHALELLKSVVITPTIHHHRKVGSNFSEYLLKPILRWQNYPNLLKVVFHNHAQEKQGLSAPEVPSLHYQTAVAIAQTIKTIINQALLNSKHHPAGSASLGELSLRLTTNLEVHIFNENRLAKHGVLIVHQFLDTPWCVVDPKAPGWKQYSLMHLYLFNDCLWWCNHGDNTSSSELLPGDSGMDVIWWSLSETIYQICPVENRMDCRWRYSIYIIEHPTPDTWRNLMMAFLTREIFLEWVEEFRKFSPEKTLPLLQRARER
ncbi:hypothetical protein EDC01DRAFT_636963 [Geopyxis carbonaria]|nr:hypothetical protein EDC01DRAFT_636963 [Geopyxis carbonaria]